MNTRYSMKKAEAQRRPRLRMRFSKECNLDLNTNLNPFLSILCAPETKTVILCLHLEEAPVKGKGAYPASVKGAVYPGAAPYHPVSLTIILLRRSLVARIGLIPALCPFPDIT